MHEWVISPSSEGAPVQPTNLLLGALEEELGGIDLGDARLNRRARRVLGQLGGKPSVSIPTTCGGWGKTRRRIARSKSKESVRWVDGFAQVNALAEELSGTRLTYIADREGDLYDLFVDAPCPDHGADWRVRGPYHERRLTDGRTLREALTAAPVLTTITFMRPAGHGKPARPVEQQLKAVRVTLKAPHRPDRRLSEVTLTALLATEIDPPTEDDKVFRQCLRVAESNKSAFP